MSRWYDARPKLRKGLDSFKEMNEDLREPILKAIIDFVGRTDPSLLTEERVENYRLDSYRLRWYEHDPYCWFVFNILEFANTRILESVENYLEKKLSLVV
jgi:hypothetical protein